LTPPLTAATRAATVDVGLALVELAVRAVGGE
jgi:hypothetical protein